VVSGRDYFNYLGSRIARFKWQGDDFASRRLHFLAPGHEMGPVGALHQDVGQNGGDQRTGRLLIEERDGIDSFESQRQFDAVVFGDDRARRSLHAASARVGVEGQDQHVTHRPRRLQGLDVPGMKQIVASIGENHGLALRAPALALLDKLGVIVEPAQDLSVTTGSRS